MAIGKGFIVAILTTIIAVVVIFNFIGTASSNLIDSADSITDANNCSEGVDATGTPLVYNYTDKTCGNSTANGLYTAKQYDLPLNTLFSRSGVTLLITMSGLLITLIALFIRKQRF